jgi:peptidyl-prolyl cis-trans isomerase C
MKTGIAALVFMLLAAVSGDRSGSLKPHDDLRHLDLALAPKLRNHPWPDETPGLPNDRIGEDIRYREVLAHGLDPRDTTASALHDPSTDELKAWFTKHAQRFQEPPRISFRQLCFSFAGDGEEAEDVATRAFRDVSGQPVDSDGGAANLADHFTFRSYYGDLTPEQVAKVFGTIFARTLFQLKPGSWQRPVESTSGWHLVWIDSIAPGHAPAFADVEVEVRSAWISERRAILRQALARQTQ